MINDNNTRRIHHFPPERKELRQPALGADYSIMGEEHQESEGEEVNMNYGAVQSDSPEEAAAESNGRLSYLKSTDFRELLASIVFFLLCLCLYLGEDSLLNRQRPIPVQYLENSNEYVANLDYDAQVNPETVSLAVLVVCTVFIPMLIQLLLSKTKNFRRIGDTHGTACAYFIAIGLTQLATEAIKLYVGYLRPIFLSICEPSDDYQTCTNDQDKVNQVRMAFVSGHASTSFCGMMLLARYTHERFGLPSAKSRSLQVLQQGADINSSSSPLSRSLHFGRFVSMLSLLPLALAVFIASSRVVDNRHFPADVVGGALLGGSIALFVHGLWL
ncbi:hypothetical protein MPSEU_000490900 [Mayamaea pseudoterrestris]|nr:hypothetical protein MPSEU_000490900 [Mayamaea pseudoterrestris]